MTKRILILLLAALSVACSREPQLVRVTFDVRGVESGPITKVSADAVSSAVSATSPAGPVTLTATSKTNSRRVYTITSGQTVTMAVDSYAITGEGHGTELVSFGGTKVYSSPKWSIEEDVNVTSSGGTVSVSASYPCVALVIDKAAISSLAFIDGFNTYDSYTAGGTESVGVVYASGYWTHATPLEIEVRPLDTVNYEATRYSLTSREYDDTYYVLNGRWYNFAPGAVETSSGTIGVEFPGFTQGN